MAMRVPPQAPLLRSLLLLGLVLLGCADRRLWPGELRDTRVYRARPANRGAEQYSAWFADSDGRVLYFGLSPFWQLWWESGGDALADLREPGDHLIGRFDMSASRFLPPLRVRGIGADSRASVWDVLVHSNGRIYYTTFFEELGWVDPATGAVQHLEGLGVGLNELVEGPGGSLYITRYSDAPRSTASNRSGALLVVTPDGDLLREKRFERGRGEVTAPKSVAVDPVSGGVWLNADVFHADGSTGYAILHLDAEGEIIEWRTDAPELLFARFDAHGRGYFVEDVDGALRLRVTRAGREQASLILGSRAPLDYAQDVHFAADSTAVISFWSGRVDLVRLDGSELSHRTLWLGKPSECAPPAGRSLLYSAFLHVDAVYATLSCGPTILATRLAE